MKINISEKKEDERIVVLKIENELLHFFLALDLNLELNYFEVIKPQIRGGRYEKIYKYTGPFFDS